jgi:hypothetical protein
VSSATADLDQKALVFDSPDDRRLIAAEAASDPAFARKLSAMLSLPDGEQRVVMYARKAVLNELNPASYPETRGQWPKLRSAVSKLIVELPRAITDIIDRMPVDQRIAAISKIRETGDVAGVLGLGDLGQWEIIGQLVGAVAGAATSVYNTRLQATTSKQIADMQLQANMAQIKAQEDMAQAQIAISNAQVAQALKATLPAPIAGAAQSAISALPAVLQGPVSSVVAAISTDIGGGIPLWLPALGIYLFFKYK